MRKLIIVNMPFKNNTLSSIVVVAFVKIFTNVSYCARESMFRNILKTWRMNVMSKVTNMNHFNSRIILNFISETFESIERPFRNYQKVLHNF